MENFVSSDRAASELSNGTKVSFINFFNGKIILKNTSKLDFFDVFFKNNYFFNF